MPGTTITAAPPLPRMSHRWLNWIERTGNRLPDPVTLFVMFCGLVLAASAVGAAAGWSVVHPATGKTIEVVSLLNGDGLRRILTDLTKNFANFPPLFTVLVAMIGVGVAEASGLLSALLRRLALATPRALLTPTVVCLSVMSSLASDVGYVVLIPLAAMLFAAAGRHPLAGLAASFAGVSGGFSANLLLGSLDPLLAGITEVAAHLVDPAYTVNAAANYYFMAASTGLVTLLAWWVTDRIVEPQLGAWKGKADSAQSAALAPAEKRGLRWAALAALVLAGLIAWAVVPEGAPLRDPKTGSLIPSPFLNGIVAVIFAGFLVPGLAYGLGAGTFRNDRDVAKSMADSMSTLGYYIVLSFFAAQFIAWFGWSQLGFITAVNGAEGLKSLGLGPMPLMVGILLMAALINLVMGSASAKWAVLAPVFVPMFMLMGIAPEATQLAYRIGDSLTNIITPLMAYFPMVVAFARKYRDDAGIGTLTAMMLPYSLVLAIGWTLFMLAWFALGVPIGPGVEAMLPTAQ
ncbi:MAG: AbgT family transporter [Betaproteobacteria bacterium]